MPYYFRGLSTTDLVNALYKYYYTLKISKTIKITKSDLRKFKKQALARALIAKEYSKFPRLFSTIVEEKKNQLKRQN